ncbi:hypothetical protein PR048_032746 [Dryococelus australis]|uniref:Uncharacterized protein n=1 Tax=Dryococelus australis TaxID=614101 RepID=A0ABQ9G325_9NEOP|nr:hypothetical protein PR048_032746 [Dryococelus australis]
MSANQKQPEDAFNNNFVLETGNDIISELRSMLTVRNTFFRNYLSELVVKCEEERSCAILMAADDDNLKNVEGYMTRIFTTSISHLATKTDVQNYSRDTLDVCSERLVEIEIVSLTTSHLGEPVSIPGGIACGNRSGRCRWSAGFLGDLPFLPPLHTGAASYSPCFTLIGSQDFDVIGSTQYSDARRQISPLHSTFLRAGERSQLSSRTTLGENFRTCASQMVSAQRHRYTEILDENCSCSSRESPNGGPEFWSLEMRRFSGTRKLKERGKMNSEPPGKRVSVRESFDLLGMACVRSTRFLPRLGLASSRDLLCSRVVSPVLRLSCDLIALECSGLVKEMGQERRTVDERKRGRNGDENAGRMNASFFSDAGAVGHLGTRRVALFAGYRSPAASNLSNQQARPVNVRRLARQTHPRRSEGKPSQTANIFSTSYGYTTLVRHLGATMTEWLARSTPTNANRVQSPAGTPDFRKWKSCRTTPLVCGFSRGSPVSSAPFILTPFHVHFNHPHRLSGPRSPVPTRLQTLNTERRSSTLCSSAGLAQNVIRTSCRAKGGDGMTIRTITTRDLQSSKVGRRISLDSLIAARKMGRTQRRAGTEPRNMTTAWDGRRLVLMAVTDRTVSPAVLVGSVALQRAWTCLRRRFNVFCRGLGWWHACHFVGFHCPETTNASDCNGHVNAVAGVLGGKNVVFSHESHFNLSYSDGRARVIRYPCSDTHMAHLWFIVGCQIGQKLANSWHSPSTIAGPEAAPVPAVKPQSADCGLPHGYRGDRNLAACIVKRHRGQMPSALIWGVIGYNMRSRLLHIEGNLNSKQPLTHTMFQQENSRPHVARKCASFLNERWVPLLPWPARSPDMSPIEHVWDMCTDGASEEGRICFGQSLEKSASHWLYRYGYAKKRTQCAWFLVMGVFAGESHPYVRMTARSTCWVGKRCVEATSLHCCRGVANLLDVASRLLEADLTGHAYTTRTFGDFPSALLVKDARLGRVPNTSIPLVFGVSAPESQMIGAVQNRYTQNGENTARQLRALYLEAMAHLISVGSSYGAFLGRSPIQVLTPPPSNRNPYSKTQMAHLWFTVGWQADKKLANSWHAPSTTDGPELAPLTSHTLPIAVPDPAAANQNMDLLTYKEPPRLFISVCQHLHCEETRGIIKPMASHVIKNNYPVHKVVRSGVGVVGKAGGRGKSNGVMKIESEETCPKNIGLRCKRWDIQSLRSSGKVPLRRRSSPLAPPSHPVRGSHPTAPTPPPIKPARHRDLPSHTPSDFRSNLVAKLSRRSERSPRRWARGLGVGVEKEGPKETKDS